MTLPSSIDVAIVAPFPTSERIREGWMSRINAVDAIFEGKRRLYINFSEHHRRGQDDAIRQLEDDGWEVCLSPTDIEHQYLINDIVSAAKIVYVHTIHLAEFMLKWLGSGKIVVDFHGIVPEEEAMLGRPELSGKYEEIEKQVLLKARTCVMVTRAMERHYQQKYPEIAPTTIILPIVESLPLSGQIYMTNRQELPVRVVYAGGTQSWQNINGMLDLASATESFADFTFLSHDWELIEETARKRNVPQKTSFRFCAKSDLSDEYKKHDFGLVLRDDTPVNRVACPTKLYEYLCIGLIPIVRTPALGDFLELNYSYVTEDEFKDSFFPDAISRKMMAKKNIDVVHQMREMFYEGANRIRQLTS